MRTFEHISAEAIERYRRRRLSGEELLSAHAHADECAECRARLERAVDVQGAFANLLAGFNNFNAPEDEQEHLPYAQLAAFVDDSLDDVEREIAESHLAVCRACAGDAVDLRRYQTIAAVSETTPANATAPARAAVSKSLWQRVASFNPVASFGLSLPNAIAAAVVVAVVLLGAWFATRPDNGAGQDQLAQVKPNGRDENLNAPAQATGAAPGNVAVENKVAVENSTSTSAQEDVASSTRNSSKSIITPPASRRPPSSTTRPSTAPATFDFALLDGGVEVAFDRRGNVRGLEELPPAVRNLVGQTLRTGSVQTPRSLDSLRNGAGGVLMGGDGGAGDVPFALVSPVGKILREQRPVLRWHALAGAASYTVAIVNADFKQVAQSEKLTATEWTPPIALERGATYFWQVTAVEPDGREITSPTPTAPQAKFRVLDARTFDELKSFAALNPNSHLALGVLYAKAGLLDEAGDELEKLVKQNPRSPVARKLLKSVR
ncbi:MAG: hypothetical protein QOD32_1177 [Pyrinomonadaceae bacterium]|jgi:anti-sigma factor RsiW|nr:hypothetical protein [Pyrinomonadaceae bacterium]